MKKIINAGTRTITFAFDGYADKEGTIIDASLAPVVFHAEALSVQNYEFAVLHGMSARIGDNAAIQKSAENNFTVTEAMRREAVSDLVTFYENADNADWNMRVAAGPRKSAPNPAIVTLAAKLGKTYEEAQAWFAAKLEAELAAMA